MPHAAESLIDIAHDLGRRITPAKLEQLLPDMASVSVNDSLWNTSKEFMNHSGLVFLGHTIESLLHDMTTERIHAQRERIATNCTGDRDDLQA